jgi:hypothetical protein
VCASDLYPHAAIGGRPLPLRFTPEESAQASEAWGANCGPHTLVAACGKTLDEARAALVFKGWMSPTMIGAAHRTFGLSYRLLCAQRSCGTGSRESNGSVLLDHGVPPAAAYNHTHWIAAQAGWVLDTIAPVPEWMPEATWRPVIETFATTNYAGWYFTHWYAINRPVSNFINLGPEYWTRR